MPWGSQMAHRLAVIALVGSLVLLVMVDLRSWGRTRLLRRGSPSVHGTPRRPGLNRSSPTTFLAGLAGASVVALGLTSPYGTGWTRLTVVAGGAFVGITGLAGRVRSIGGGPRGLMIDYAGRPPILLRWADIRELRPPSTPLGGWRLIGTADSRSLMPSDLLHGEGVLVEAIERAELVFDGHTWTNRANQRPETETEDGSVSGG